MCNFPHGKRMTGSFSQFVSVGLSPAEGAVLEEKEEDEAQGGLDAWWPRLSPPRSFHPCSCPQKQQKKPGGAPLSDPHHGANWEFPLGYHRSSRIQNGRGDLCLCFGLSETTLSTSINTRGFFSTKAWPDPVSGSLGWRQKGADCRPGGNWEYCPAGTLNLFASKSSKEEQVSFPVLITRKQQTGFIKFPCP